MGAAVGGALLAVLAMVCYTWLKRRRRDRKASHSFAAEDNKITPRNLGVLDHLPQAVADETFRQKLRKLSTDIKNCVDSFFNDKHVQLDASAEVSLQNLAGQPIDETSWSAAFLNDNTRPYVIRLLIAQIMFKSIHPRHHAEVCLLPHQLLVVYQTFHKFSGISRRGNESRSGTSFFPWFMKPCATIADISPRHTKPHTTIGTLVQNFQPSLP